MQGKIVIWSWKLFQGQDEGCALGKTMLALPRHLLCALRNGFHLLSSLQGQRLGWLAIVPWIFLLDGGHGICLCQSSGTTIRCHDLVKMFEHDLIMSSQAPSAPSGVADSVPWTCVVFTAFAVMCPVMWSLTQPSFMVDIPSFCKLCHYTPRRGRYDSKPCK